MTARPSHLARIVLALLLPIAIARAEGPSRLLDLCDVEISPLDGMASDVAYAPAANRSAYRLEGTCEPLGIWVADEEGGGRKQVLGDSGDVQFRVLSLSPDGRFLAYLRLTPQAPPTVMGVGILEVATGRKTEIAGTAVAWTPKGDLAAVADPVGGKVRVVEVPSLASRTVSWRSGGGDPLERPRMAWSPDGASLAFAFPEPSPARLSLWVVGAKGGDARAVLEEEGCLAITPFWAPDGRVAWARTDADGTRLFVVGEDGKPKGIDGGEPLQLAGDPSWSPDGKRILFARTIAGADGSQTDLWQIDPATGELSRLTQAGDASGEVAWSAGGGTAFLQDGERVRFVHLEMR